jgi:hypothetical protein
VTDFDSAAVDHGPMVCSACPDGTLVEHADRLGYHCDTCSYDDTICDCGKRLTFDETMRGTTCGGHQLVGWRVCSCGATPTLCRLSKSADAVDWRLASSGRSLTAGGIKVRAEAAPGVAELMARIVRVPELELEVEQLRAQLARRVAR